MLSSTISNFFAITSEIIFHYFTIIFLHDFTGHINFIHEDSPVLDMAYKIAGFM